MSAFKKAARLAALLVTTPKTAKSSVEPARIHLVTCVGVETELPMLSHFIAHYRALGVPAANMHVILNAPSGASSQLAEAQRLLREAGTPAPQEWIAPYTSIAMWAKRREIQKQRVEKSDWVLNADVDEFHEYPEALDTFLATCEQWKVDSVQSVFVDRVAAGGRLNAVAATPSIWEQFPVIAEVQCSIGQPGYYHGIGGSVVMMAHRSWIHTGRGGHRPARKLLSRARFLYGDELRQFSRLGDYRFRFALPLRVHHFKWTAGLVPSLHKRLAAPGVSPAGAEYGGKVLAHIARYDRINIDRMSTTRTGPGSTIGWPRQVRRIFIKQRLARIVRRALGKK